VAAEAATAVFTNEAQFVAAAENLPLTLNQFNDPDYFGRLVHPILYATNGVSYNLASQPALRLVGFNGAVSTHDSTDGILVTFTSTNIIGLGGYFFAADTNAETISGSVTLRLSDGTVTNVSSFTGSPASFMGFLSDATVFTTLSITNTTGLGYPALAHLYVVSALPTLTINLSDTNAAISWDAANGFLMQTSPDMKAGTWEALNLVPQLYNNRFNLTVPISSPSQFFRLLKM